MISESKISTLLTKWSKKMKLTKKNIMWTNSFSQWKKFVKNSTPKCLSPFGAVNLDSKNHLIFINIKRHGNNLKEIENTIRHELNHIKHPNFSESKIRKITKKILS